MAPGLQGYGVKKIAKTILGVTLDNFTSLGKEKNKWNTVPLSLKKIKYASNDAITVLSTMMILSNRTHPCENIMELIQKMQTVMEPFVGKVKYLQFLI